MARPRFFKAKKRGATGGSPAAPRPECQKPGLGAAGFQNALHSLDVTFNPATTFHAKLTSASPGYENHRLQVAGAVDLGGCMLDLELSFIPSPGQKFVLIENDGTDRVVGTFAGLPEGAVFAAPAPNLHWRVSYAGGDGNDVMLTLVGIDFKSVLSAPAIRLADGVLSMTISATGVPAAIYDVETSSDLTSWMKVFSLYASSRGLLEFSLPTPPDVPWRFYRLKLP